MTTPRLRVPCARRSGHPHRLTGEREWTARGVEKIVAKRQRWTSWGFDPGRVEGISGSGGQGRDLRDCKPCDNGPNAHNFSTAHRRRGEPCVELPRPPATCWNCSRFYGPRPQARSRRPPCHSHRRLGQRAGRYRARHRDQRGSCPPCTAGRMNRRRAAEEGGRDREAAGGSAGKTLELGRKPR